MSATIMNTMPKQLILRKGGVSKRAKRGRHITNPKIKTHTEAIRCLIRMLGGKSRTIIFGTTLIKRFKTARKILNSMIRDSKMNNGNIMPIVPQNTAETLQRDCRLIWIPLC